MSTPARHPSPLPAGRHPRTARAALALLTTLLPTLALAHPGGADAGHHGLLGGFLHPLGGADHLAMMLAVGLWSGVAARRGRADLLFVPLTFLACLLTGGLLAHAGLALPALEPLVAASLLGMGLLLAWRTQWPLPWVMPAVAAFAFLHGAAHGGELDGMAALAGMVLGSALLHAVGAAAGIALRGRRDTLRRWAGAGLGLLGVTLLLGLAT